MCGVKLCLIKYREVLYYKIIRFIELFWVLKGVIKIYNYKKEDDFKNRIYVYKKNLLISMYMYKYINRYINNIIK